MISHLTISSLHTLISSSLSAPGIPAFIPFTLGLHLPARHRAASKRCVVRPPFAWRILVPTHDTSRGEALAVGCVRSVLALDTHLLTTRDVCHQVSWSASRPNPEHSLKIFIVRWERGRLPPGSLTPETSGRCEIGTPPSLVLPRSFSFLQNPTTESAHGTPSMTRRQMGNFNAPGRSVRPPDVTADAATGDSECADSSLPSLELGSPGRRVVTRILFSSPQSRTTVASYRGHRPRKLLRARRWAHRS